ncbi:BglII/BstYI family type II restriction endonuclease [Methylomonas sp. EFPC3]|uniref:BglII/BstYI family type II restriction endonuclease n=1 Tax=Methylomonas sp. EFPC3 TaxID=3021710 RepID=UPI002417EE1A|nr:BglII/BstYI family type II restriction endonuclease [Methylomonas sp. EFPC3]WFP49305.1 BglII/BstYI family type II restriction endonuclease [Methylomonas sp. EFPC3]
MENGQDPELDNENSDKDHKTEANGSDDVSLCPGPNADYPADVDRYISAEVRALYDVYSYRHAAAILANSFPEELKEIEAALLAFRITKRDLGRSGGDETFISKRFSNILRPNGWVESRIQGDLLVRVQEFDEQVLANGKVHKVKRPDTKPRLIEAFTDRHKLDYVKGRVAFDFEWKSTRQNFDRDLHTFRAFHEFGLISAGILVTRSEKLKPPFDNANKLGDETVKASYGASTAWMGNLLHRLNAGLHEGCPILVFGITPKLIEDWEQT